MKRFVHLLKGFTADEVRELKEEFSKIELALKMENERLRAKNCTLMKESMEKQSLIVDLETTLMAKSSYFRNKNSEDFEDYYEANDDY